MNSMCLCCKNAGHSCNGTNNDSYTGCIYREVDIEKQKEISIKEFEEYKKSREPMFIGVKEI